MEVSAQQSVPIAIEAKTVLLSACTRCSEDPHDEIVGVAACGHGRHGQFGCEADLRLYPVKQPSPRCLNDCASGSGDRNWLLRSATSSVFDEMGGLAVSKIAQYFTRSAECYVDSGNNFCAEGKRSSYRKVVPCGNFLYTYCSRNSGLQDRKRCG